MSANDQIVTHVSSSGCGIDMIDSDASIDDSMFDQLGSLELGVGAI